jgi:hypothetical protein
MAEIEIDVMCRQALAKPLPDMDSFKKQLASWTQQRNIHCSKVNWQFTTNDDRIKLNRLYPSIL